MKKQVTRVLLVEDDEDDYVVTRNLLSKAFETKFELEWTASYDMALSAMGQNAHHVYLLDYYLGEKTGLELLKEASQCGCLRPVILLTGQGNYDIDVEAMKAGAADYLDKGQLTPYLLERSIRYAIAAKESEVLLKKAYDELEQKVQERTAELALANDSLKTEIRQRCQVEAALKESESLFRSLVENTPVGVFIFQSEHVIYANPGLCRMLGINAREVPSLNIWEFMHPEEREMARARVLKKIAGDDAPIDCDLRFLPREGGGLWINLLASRVVYKGQNALLGTLFDITDRKRSEEILRKKELLNQLFLDSIPHASLLIRRDGMILAANRSMRELGARVGEYCWQTSLCSMYRAPGNGSSPKPSGRNHKKCPSCHAEQALKENRPVHYPDCRIEGKIWDMWWVPVDSEVVLTYSINVTEQKKAQAALAENEERYRLLVENMNEGLMIQDDHGLLRFVNGKMCDMLGYGRSELIGRHYFEIFAEKEQGKIATKFQSSERVETVLKKKDNKPISASVIMRPLIDESGTIRGKFAFFTDITELSALRQRMQLEDGFEGLVSRDSAMLSLFSTIQHVASFDSPVLIQGETGTGKELAALAIHHLSTRAGMRFLPVNCAALPEGLLESEMFGHTRGAFTGAIHDKKGKFELADGGTLFLDEIGELSTSIQVKLLRVLQDKMVDPVGGERSLKVDVRIVSATNKDLREEVKAGRFREDLYYRLCVVPIQIPPLRDRRGDIPLLFTHFMRRSREGHSPEVAMSKEAMSILTHYHWPGNVRELQNAVQFSLIKSQGKTIESQHLPEHILQAIVLHSGFKTRRNRRRKIDEQRVMDALSQSKGNKAEAAQILGVSRATLYRFIDEFMSDHKEENSETDRSTRQSRTAHRRQSTKPR